MSVLLRFIISLILMVWVSTSRAKDCTFTFKKGTEKLNWTAFKTTDRVGVSGTFSKIKWKQKGSRSLKKLLKTVSFEIDGKTVDTKNKSRDKTLATVFFANMKDEAKIKGVIKEVNKRWPQALVMLTMNGKKHPVIFKFKEHGQKFTAESELHMLKSFTMNKPLAALKKACFDLHKGPDGQSMTWPNVELKIEAEYIKDCK